MWLIDTETFALQEGLPAFFKDEGYAILSHRWEGQEISFEQYTSHLPSLSSEKALPTRQLQKIRGACQTAASQGLKWVWIDSCCINKGSSAELAESLNSMFKWYKDAKVCLTYLGDVQESHALAQMGEGEGEPSVALEVSKTEDQTGSLKSSVWFTRGWTLQELLASRIIHFYDREWKFLGTKMSLAQELADATGIDIRYLRGEVHFGEACIATKMSWIANRTTVREEDMAYSMLGIFNVTMVPQYGEGSRAFEKLQHILLSSLTDESLFAWRMPQDVDESLRHHTAEGWADDQWGLLALHPSWFKDSGQISTSQPEDSADLGGIIPTKSGDFSLTQEGIQIPVRQALMKKRYASMGMPAMLLGPLAIIALPVVMTWQVKLAFRLRNHPAYVLNCWEKDSTERSTRVCLFLREDASTDGAKKRFRSTEFVLMTKSRLVNGYGGTGSSYLVLQPKRGYED